MDFFTRMFTTMFRSSTRRYQTRLTAQVRRNTVGKVQAKAMTSIENLDQKAYKMTDKATGLNKKKGPPPSNVPTRASESKAGAEKAAQLGGSKTQQARSGAPAQGGGVGRAAASPARPPAGAVATKQQDSSKMGKGKRNKNQAAMVDMCMNCGSGLQADWDMCPYCGTQVGVVGPQAPAPIAGMPQPQAMDLNEKTMAISLDELNTKATKYVVGWIVAQNGNHRGEDFRIYDGKNILGTAADCDIVITDPFLSAKHCTIRHENGVFQLTDLDSMNGTFVNQKRCTKSDLIDNDTIRLGRTEFKFKSLF
ncbi:MAG: FHA domain-containing protein [Bradymonadales bacterium]|jgi:hypothetical protein